MLKLYSWLGDHSEEEIGGEDIQELEIIRKNIIEYLLPICDFDGCRWMKNCDSIDSFV